LNFLIFLERFPGIPRKKGADLSIGKGSGFIYGDGVTGLKINLSFSFEGRSGFDGCNGAISLVSAFEMLGCVCLSFF